MKKVIIIITLSLALFSLSACDALLETALEEVNSALEQETAPDGSIANPETPSEEDVPGDDATALFEQAMAMHNALDSYETYAENEIVVTAYNIGTDTEIDTYDISNNLSTVYFLNPYKARSIAEDVASGVTLESYGASENGVITVYTQNEGSWITQQFDYEPETSLEGTFGAFSNLKIVANETLGELETVKIEGTASFSNMAAEMQSIFTQFSADVNTVDILDELPDMVVSFNIDVNSGYLVQSHFDLTQAMSLYNEKATQEIINQGLDEQYPIAYRVDRYAATTTYGNFNAAQDFELPAV